MIPENPRSSWRSPPWGFLGALVLILGIDRCGMRDNPAHHSEHAANWQYAARAVERHASGHEVLGFGDSLLKFGLLPSVIQSQTGLSTYNFAATLGPAPASYFLLRRALNQGARPKAIVVDFMGGIQQEGPTSEKLPYPWAELLRASEAIDLAWHSSNPELFTRTILEQWIHSYKDRFEVQARIQNHLQGVAHERAGVIALLRNHWSRNRGAQVNVKASFVDLDPPEGPERSRWSCHPVNERYIHRFMALALQYRIPVYWVIPPVSPMMQQHDTYRGESLRFDAFVKRTQGSFSNLFVIDGRNSGLDRTYFVDHRHLDHDGGAILSAGIGEVIANGLMRGAKQTRWTSLPDLTAMKYALVAENSKSSITILGPKRRR